MPHRHGTDRLPEKCRSVVPKNEELHPDELQIRAGARPLGLHVLPPLENLCDALRQEKGQGSLRRRGSRTARHLSERISVGLGRILPKSPLERRCPRPTAGEHILRRKQRPVHRGHRGAQLCLAALCRPEQPDLSPRARRGMVVRQGKSPSKLSRVPHFRAWHEAGLCKVDLERQLF